MRKNPLPPRSIKDRMKEMESYKDQSSDVVKDFGKLTEDKILKTFMPVPKVCQCGNYEPTSLTGVIIDDCKNCGNKRPPMLIG